MFKRISNFHKTQTHVGEDAEVRIRTGEPLRDKTLKQPYRVQMFCETTNLIFACYLCHGVSPI